MRLDHNLVGLKHIHGHLLDEFMDLAVNLTFSLFRTLSILPEHLHVISIRNQSGLISENSVDKHIYSE